MACLRRCDLKVKEWLFVERLLAGDLLHWSRCHIVVTWRSVYVLAEGEKEDKDVFLNIYTKVSP